jgi:hypothetical protein
MGINIAYEYFVCKFKRLLLPYGGSFGTLLWVSLALATTRQSAKRPIVALSSCRFGSSAARQTAHCRAACCRNVTLSLGSNWRIGLKDKWQGDIAIMRRTTTCHLACRARDKTIVRQRAVWRFVVLLCLQRQLDAQKRTKSATIHYCTFSWLIFYCYIRYTTYTIKTLLLNTFDIFKGFESYGVMTCMRHNATFDRIATPLFEYTFSCFIQVSVSTIHKC